MSVSMESIQASCEKVCRELAEREKSWLDAFYAPSRSPGSIKQTETVELVQHVIDLPLQAQNRVLELFREQGVTRVHTAWRELSEQMPKLDYEYVNWSRPRPAESSARRRADGRTMEPRQRLSGLLYGRKTYPDTQRPGAADETGKPGEIIRRRIEAAKNNNKDRVDDWCAELADLMAGLIAKELRRGGRIET